MKERFLPSAFGAFVLIATIGACADDMQETITACGGSPRVDSARLNGQAGLGFEVLLPTYLPVTTASTPEVTTNPNDDDITLVFPPCPGTGSQISGPQVVVEETSHAVTLPEPGSSNPGTEELRLGGASVLMQRGYSANEASIALSWQQGRIYLFGKFSWTDHQKVTPELEPELENEARRVVESMISQH